MSEVLYLHYYAHIDSILVRVDAVTPTGIVSAGGVQPESHMTLAELGEAASAAGDPQLVSDIRSILRRLEPLTRSHAEALLADPEKIRAEANRLASAKQAHETELRQIASARAAHETELRQIAVARAALASEKAGA